MYHHRIPVLKQFVEPFAAFCILLDNLDIHIIGSCQGYSYGGFAATHDDDVLHVGIMLFTYNLTYIRYILSGSHKVCQVVHSQLVHTAGNDGVAISFYGYDVVGVVWSTQIL